MRESLAMTGFWGASGFALGISPDHLQTLATLGAIIVGWVWIESRMERIVKKEMEVHTAAENEWREAISKQIERILEEKGR